MASAAHASTGCTVSRAHAGTGPIVAIDVGHHCICAAITLAPKVDRTPEVINLGLQPDIAQNYSAVLIKKSRSIGSLSSATYADVEFGEDATVHHHDGYLFKWFKMLLDSDSLENVMATAVNDASAKCKVSTLMRLLLEWAQQVVFDRMHERVGMDTVDMDSITWVITVPAIWSPGAKAFMRQAAYQAGMMETLNSPRLQLALEPECAAISTLLENPTLLATDAKVGNNIMIVDAGAGTIDIAVLQVQSHRPLKVRQIQLSSGKQLGSTKVDQAFLAMMADILGPTAHAAYSTADHEELQLLTEWERMKLRFRMPKSVTGGSKWRNKQRNAGSGAETVPLGGILRVTGMKLEEVRDRVAMYNTSKGFTGSDALLVQDYGSSGSAWLVIPASAIRRLFDSVVKQVCDLVAADINSANKAKGAVVDLICLAGGFAHSDVLQAGIKGLGAAPVRVPLNPARSIARGAAHFACDPHLVQERIATYTIGINVNRRRVDDTHPKKHAFTADDGIEYDDDLFCCLVKRGDVVPSKHVVRKSLFTCRASATGMTCKLYQTTSVDPQHTYDAGVRSLGVSVTVKVGEKNDKKDDKTAVFRFKVGGTEAVAALNADLTSDRCTKTMSAAAVFGT